MIPMLAERIRDSAQSPLIMGIVNVTPDSFSDGGQHDTTDRAVAHALKLVAEGADILDIGGESTRPGAAPVSALEEQARVLPVLRALAQAGCGVPVSVDTRNASTMRAALEEGAAMINDITALLGDPQAFEVVRDTNCFVCLMHMQGRPQTMQKNPHYNNVVEDVFKFLSSRILDCDTNGIDKKRLIVDPGIGFGKDLSHNLDLLHQLDRFASLGVPLLLGVSRKRFIAHICEGADVKDRLPGSLAAALYGLTRGARILRVHDVAQTVQALKVWRAIEERSS